MYEQQPRNVRCLDIFAPFEVNSKNFVISPSSSGHSPCGNVGNGSETIELPENCSQLTRKFHFSISFKTNTEFLSKHHTLVLINGLFQCTCWRLRNKLYCAAVLNLKRRSNMCESLLRVIDSDQIIYDVKRSAQLFRMRRKYSRRKFAGGFTARRATHSGIFFHRVSIFLFIDLSPQRCSN